MEEQNKMKIKDKKEKIKEKRIKLNIWCAPCTLRRALFQIPVLTTFCVWQQSISYMEIYLR